MDQNKTAQNTKNGILSNLAKEAKDAEIKSEPLVKQAKDSVAKNYSNEEVKEAQCLGDKLAAFETKVGMADRDPDVEWLETDADILTSICRGVYPEVGYIVYKNVRVCEHGRAEELAKADGQTAYEKVFPKHTDVTYTTKGK